MKIKLTISLMLGMLTVAFIFNTTSPEITTVTPAVETPDPETGLPNRFLTGAFNNAYMTNQGSYSYLDELNMNLWHSYPVNNPDINTGTNNRGWYRHTQKDLLENQLNQYAGDIQDVISANNSNNLYTLMNRIKIDQLGYGARSDYQAEKKSYIANPDLDAYCYNTSYDDNFSVDDMIDSSPFGNNARVKHCMPIPNYTPSGGFYILKDLNMNREQADMNSKYWIDDWVHKWLVKPSIRIKPDDAFANKRVCKIEVLNWDGDELVNRSYTITGNNFLDQGSYDGKYLEKYSSVPFDKLEFGGTGSNTEINPNRISPGNWNIPCGIDIRVWWYGECEMWIDYVRVDNDIANDLLAYPPNPNTILYNQRLQEEAQQQLACFNNSPVKFYIEEWEFNNLPCLAYVSRKLKEYSTGAGGCGRNINLAVALNYSRMLQLFPDRWGWHSPMEKYGWSFVKRYLVDSL